MDIVMGIGSLAIIAAYFIREKDYKAACLAKEAKHKHELENSYNEGYKAGLYENIVKMSSED